MHWEVADYPSEVCPESEFQTETDGSDIAEYRPFQVDMWEYSREYLFGDNSTYYPPHEPQLGRLQTPWPWRWERDPPLNVEGPPDFFVAQPPVHLQSVTDKSEIAAPPVQRRVKCLRRSVRVKSKSPTSPATHPPVRHQSDIEPITPLSPTGGKSPSLCPKNFPTF